MKKLRFAKQIGYNKENMNMEEEKGAEALSLQNGNKTESPYKSKTLTDIYGKTVAGLEKLRQRTGANRDPQKDGVAVTDKFKETLRESVAKYTGRTPQEHWNEAENALLGGLTQLRKRYEAEYLLREKTANYSDYLARMQEAADDPEIMKATIAWGKNRVDPGVKAAAEAAAAEATDAQLDALLKSARTDTEQAAFQAEIARRKAAGAGTAAAAQEAIKPETALYDLLSAEDRADMLSLREIGYAPDAETIKAKLQNEMEAIDLRIGYDMLDGQALQDAEARKQQIAEGLQAFDAQSAAAQEREAAIAAEEESEAVKAYKALQESGADIFFSQRYQQEQQQ